MSRITSEVIEAARAGGEWAWEIIYRDLAPGVLGYLRGRGANDPEAVVGETFVVLVARIHTFKGGPEAFRTWVFVTAYRRLLDEVRRRKSRPQVVTDNTTALESAEGASDSVDALANSELAVHLDALTPLQREVVLLRVLGGLSIAEVAGVIGRREGAVKALQRRGLAALRARLERSGGRIPSDARDDNEV